jgi:alkylation response protein AidB-like acyl-CoA dehydrogenase
MDFPLMPASTPGEQFVALAEAHAADFWTRAPDHDRDATFVHENFEAMRTSGFAAAFVPAELGGLGVTSRPCTISPPPSAASRTAIPRRQSRSACTSS